MTHSRLASPRARHLAVVGLLIGVCLLAPERVSAWTADEIAAGRSHWAFQPPVDRPPPAVRDDAWPRTPIDRHLLAALEDAGITPVADTDRATLIRRLAFDLTGLPPTPAEVDTFLADKRPDAWQRLVDRLLDGPAYGEKWGRHWLDVARYADSNGLDENLVFKNAHRYRDWVVSAINRDIPIDRFIQLQVAGDLLSGAGPDGILATGYLSLGAKMLAEDDPAKQEYDIIDEQVDTLGKTFLGLTIGCARCHDHKFDPLPQADYYRTLAFFRGVRPYTEPNNTPESSTLLPLGDTLHVRDAIVARDRRRQEAEAKIAQLPEGEERKRWESERDRLRVEGLEWTLAVREQSEQPPETHVLVRGNAGTPSERVEPATLAVLTDTAAGTPAAAGNTPEDAKPRSESPLRDLFPTSGRRLQFARWLTRPDHPLTARVLVNRVWHYHFGRGLVATTGDFGKAGVAPTHPELLDWLTADFIANGWSIKHLHRTIMRSATYQRSSEVPAVADTAAPGVSAATCGGWRPRPFVTTCWQ